MDLTCTKPQVYVKINRDLEPKLVNSNYIEYAVNSLGVGDLQIRYEYNLILLKY